MVLSQLRRVKKALDLSNEQPLELVPHLLCQQPADLLLQRRNSVSVACRSRSSTKRPIDLSLLRRVTLRMLTPFSAHSRSHDVQNVVQKDHDQCREKNSPPHRNISFPPSPSGLRPKIWLATPCLYASAATACFTDMLTMNRSAAFSFQRSRKRRIYIKPSAFCTAGNIAKCFLHTGRPESRLQDTFQDPGAGRGTRVPAVDGAHDRPEQSRDFSFF